MLSLLSLVASLPFALWPLALLVASLTASIPIGVDYAIALACCYIAAKAAVLVYLLGRLRIGVLSPVSLIQGRPPTLVALDHPLEPSADNILWFGLAVAALVPSGPFLLLGHVTVIMLCLLSDHLAHMKRAG